MKSAIARYKLGWIALIGLGVFFGLLERYQPQSKEIDPDILLMRIIKVATDNRIVADKNGKILYASETAADIFGYKATELVGMNIEKLIPDRYIPEHRAAKDEAVKKHTGKISPPVPCYGKMKGGTERKIELRAKVDWEPGLGETIMVTVFPIEMVKPLEK